MKHKQHYVISMITNEATGEVTVAWNEIDGPLVHKITRSSARGAKNAIKQFANTGIFPEDKKKAGKPAMISEVKAAAAAAPIPPTGFQYLHRRCQQPVFISERETALVNNIQRIILILKDATGKVYRVYEDIMQRYLSPLGSEVANG